MKKFYLFTIMFTLMGTVQAKSLENMEIKKRCESYTELALVYWDNYFNGQSREEQYNLVEEKIQDEVGIVFSKKLIDIAYDYIPFPVNESERKAYRKDYSSMFFNKCIIGYEASN
ncbi:hypothetical protein [Acinetobacter pittii]|uniref:hypothetical protein n=1 Tax=Acinetobacter pittii TaxID=48296 RepID=UPI002AFF8367|nr:hypothetical protein [Acinetobacter pittii]